MEMNNSNIKDLMDMKNYVDSNNGNNDGTAVSPNCGRIDIFSINVTLNVNCCCQSQ